MNKKLINEILNMDREYGYQYRRREKLRQELQSLEASILKMQYLEKEKEREIDESKQQINKLDDFMKLFDGDETNGEIISQIKERLKEIEQLRSVYYDLKKKIEFEKLLHEEFKDYKESIHNTFSQQEANYLNNEKGRLIIEKSALQDKIAILVDQVEKLSLETVQLLQDKKCEKFGEKHEELLKDKMALEANQIQIIHSFNKPIPQIAVSQQRSSYKCGGAGFLGCFSASNPKPRIISTEEDTEITLSANDLELFRTNFLNIQRPMPLTSINRKSL